MGTNTRETNDVGHRFCVAPGDDDADAARIMRIFHVVGVKCLCTPSSSSSSGGSESSRRYDDLFPMFDFARYGKRDHIAKHDDQEVCCGFSHHA